MDGCVSLRREINDKGGICVRSDVTWGEGFLWSFVTKCDGGWWVGQKRVILASRNYWTFPYLSSVFKILRKENKIFQDLRISTDLADFVLECRGIFEGWKVGCITYLKIYIEIKVNTMGWDYNGRRAFDLSGKAHFSADSVIFTKSAWSVFSGT